MLFYENLEEIIFNRHQMFDVDELIVLSGYVGPQPVSKLSTLPFQSSVIYGMYGSDSISEKLHGTLTKLNENQQNTTIKYSKMPVHSKCYVWRKDKKIVTALLGSANFSVSGLSNPYKEVLAETTFDTFKTLNKYLDVVFGNCIDCTDADIKLKKSTKTAISMIVDESIDSHVCRATLLNRSGNVPEKSGLNWGLSTAHTSDGDAYIKISKEYLKLQPLLFPQKQLEESRIKEGGKKTRQNDAVEFIWDDGTVMEGLLEGTQFIENVPYPKQICSSPKKNVLGLYLRERLGVSTKHLITVEDLKNYGRTTIDISLQAEGVYYLDFSKNI